MDSNTFSLEQLCTLSGLTRRTVRFYIQKGLLARPEGEKRGAYYLSSHLDTLLRIKQLTEAGISLDRIKEVLGGEPPAVSMRPASFGSVEIRSHIRIAPGIEVQITPEQAHATPEEIRALAKEVLAAWNRIKEDNHDI